MAKRSLLIMSLLGFMMLLIGCVSVDTIKSDFEEAKYTYSEDASTWISGLLTEFEENGVTIHAHVFTSGLKTAIVLEFDGSKELKEQLSESETLKGLIADLDEIDLVRGNFLLIPMALTEEGINEMIEVFNGDYKPQSK